MKIKSLTEANLKNKKIVLRVDFNVPLKNGKVADDTRIKESLPTIQYLLKQNCSIVILAHLGRPEGKFSSDLSLKPVAKHLQKLLAKKVFFLNDCQGPVIESFSQNLKSKQIVLLENLRFHAEEEKNDQKFAKNLSHLGEVYVDDAFGCAHRAHASITGITNFIPSYAGFLLEKEVKALSPLLGQLKEPVTMIIGGAKIDTKIDLIKSFAGRCDHFIFGGGIANTFLAAKKFQLGKSLVEKDKIKTAAEIETLIRRKHKNVHLPVDFRIAENTDKLFAKTFSGKKLPASYMALDIGPKAEIDFAQVISQSKTIIWNGPMGVYEKRPFRKGTKKIAKAVAAATQKGALTVLGGGDTVDALQKIGVSTKKFSHVSTGGGAMLEFLQNGTLPGLEVLR